MAASAYVLFYFTASMFQHCHHILKAFPLCLKLVAYSITTSLADDNIWLLRLSPRLYGVSGKNEANCDTLQSLFDSDKMDAFDLDLHCPGQWIYIYGDVTSTSLHPHSLGSTRTLKQRLAFIVPQSQRLKSAL
jgi:hypothetical protein